MKRRDDPAFARESLTTLQTQIDRIGRIVRGVSNLARKPGDAWVVVELNGCPREAITLVRSDKRAANIDFRATLADGLARSLRARTSSAGVHQSSSNAVEAMSGGGLVEIATAA
jgi:nitrogen fixation/metabolism regulation signal transduction histidine kinase